MNDKNTYDPKYFQPLFDAEDRHFWFITRNQILENVLAKLDTLLPNGYYALESGCGDGNTLRVLESTCHNGKVIGSDLFHSGLLRISGRFPCMRRYISVAWAKPKAPVPEGCPPVPGHRLHKTRFQYRRLQSRHLPHE